MDAELSYLGHFICTYLSVLDLLIDVSMYNGNVISENVRLY